MNISEAVLSRSSIREFKDSPVSNSLIKDLLEKSSHSPSGGNLQPWNIFVLNEKSMSRFLEFQSAWDKPETPAYEIYPQNLKEPYRTSRYQLGEEMYSLLNISREDKEARINQVMKNFSFFGAPAALFCFIDKTMGPPQWSDLGMFLQTFMLLALGKGLDTCAARFGRWPALAQKFVGAENSILFCGMAIGYKSDNSIINDLRSTRRPINEWATFL